MTHSIRPCVAVLKEGQMLDFLGFIATAALMVLAVNAVITFMDVSPSAKLTLATLAGRPTSCWPSPSA